VEAEVFPSARPLTDRHTHRETKLCTNPPGCTLNCAGSNRGGEDPTISIGFGGRHLNQILESRGGIFILAKARPFSDLAAALTTKTPRTPAGYPVYALCSRFTALFLHTLRVVLLPLNRHTSTTLRVFRLRHQLRPGDSHMDCRNLDWFTATALHVQSGGVVCEPDIPSTLVPIPA
jgi:hypothetical protein